MRHRMHNRILGRTRNHRVALMRGLTSALLEHRSIVTTEAKAKELRKHIEPLITRAKSELTLARRRQLLSKLARAEDLMPLVEIAKEHSKRPGGYLRLTRMPNTRSDNAQTMRVDIVPGKKA